ncbi:hypothetical protein NDI44_08695 [Trichocoleus sp. DQ-A3]|uniref:hypothetical protein n=1 Tax=Cyanophyceae TaxID=3028117 RepID=UPI00168594A3|nr:hypothetical protein [Coleofasciculus sp. FACHB-125]MBD1899269.1 hypothetical protein [Coleofasciculus sp. FACHB-125]
MTTRHGTKRRQSIDPYRRQFRRLGVTLQFQETRRFRTNCRRQFKIHPEIFPEIFHQITLRIGFGIVREIFLGTPLEMPLKITQPTDLGTRPGRQIRRR